MSKGVFSSGLSPGPQGPRLREAWPVAFQKSLPSRFLRKQEFFRESKEEKVCDSYGVRQGSGRLDFLSKVWETQPVSLVLSVVFVK